MPPKDTFTPDNIGLSDFFRIKHEIDQQSDRGAAIIAASFVEQHLKWALTADFVDLSERTSERLFSGNGPLSTFYSRTMLGFALGLFDRVTREELIAISNIRNVFAHTVTPIDFKNHKIKDLCARLQYPAQYNRRYGLGVTTLRSDFEYSCWILRSVLTTALRRKRRPDKSDSDFIEAAEEALFSAGPRGISAALPHVHPQNEGPPPSDT